MDKRWLLVVMVVGIVAGVGIYFILSMEKTIGRSSRVVEWIRNPSAHPDWAVRAGPTALPAPHSSCPPTV